MGLELYHEQSSFTDEKTKKQVEYTTFYVNAVINGKETKVPLILKEKNSVIRDIIKEQTKVERQID